MPFHSLIRMFVLSLYCAILFFDSYICVVIVPYHLNIHYSCLFCIICTLFDHASGSHMYLGKVGVMKEESCETLWLPIALVGNLTTPWGMVQVPCLKMGEADPRSRDPNPTRKSHSPSSSSPSLPPLLFSSKIELRGSGSSLRVCPSRTQQHIIASSL